MFRVTVTFTAVGDRTELDMTMTLPSPEAAAETRKFIKKAGGDSTWDRFAEYLAAETTGKQRFVINRSFDAPIARVYEAWTNPEHFTRWLPTTGFTMKFLRADLRVGGTTHSVITNGKDVTMYGRARYLELGPPHRIVYTQEFVDEREQPARHPLASTWPAVMRTTVVLTEEGPDRTRVTLTWDPHGEVTPVELETFMKARGGCTSGWTGSFDKLEELLAGS
jgi:uncharacterized protein YndB with AHSA1/START domain